jgi:gliding motility-associated-like protein
MIGSRPLTLLTPAAYSNISILSLSSDIYFGGDTFSVILTFTDHSTSNLGTFENYDWQSPVSTANSVYHSNYITPSRNSCPYVNSWPRPIYIFAATVPTGSCKPIKSITFIPTLGEEYGATTHLVILAVSGVVSTLPIITVSPANDTICMGNSLNLAASGAVSYNWTPSTGLSCTNCPNPTASPTVTTNYTITGYNADSCTADTTITIYVAPPPAIAITAFPSTLCSGSTVTLSASSTGGANLYTWQPGALTGASITVTPTVTTTYTVYGSNACSSASESTTIYVNPLPVPNLSADLYQGCAPLCIQFMDRTTIPSGNIARWSWSFGNGDTSLQKNPLYCYPDTGTFTVTHTAISDSGCSATLQVVKLITLFSKPVAKFIYSPQPISIIEPTVQFTDESADAYGIVYWNWNFGDSQESGAENLPGNPKHTYSDTGTYCPQLVVMNNKGCLDTVTNCLEVNPLFTFYIPDAFSPNGDGLNDVFMPKGSYVKNYELFIFDRWGNQLFHSTEMSNGWDGTVKGTVCQEATYVYVIHVTDSGDKIHLYIGNITLLK